MTTRLMYALVILASLILISLTFHGLVQTPQVAAPLKAERLGQLPEAVLDSALSAIGDSIDFTDF